MSNAQNKNKISKATEIRYQWIRQRILAGELDMGALNTRTVPEDAGTSMVTYPRLVATVWPELQEPLLRINPGGNRVRFNAAENCVSHNQYGGTVVSQYYTVWHTVRHGRRSPTTTAIDHNS